MAEAWVNVTVRMRPEEVDKCRALAKKRADKQRANVSLNTLLRGFMLDGMADAERVR